MPISYESEAGELAVLEFVIASYRRKLVISRPINFDPGYDVVVHNPRVTEQGRADVRDIWRVQVKTADHTRGGKWQGNTHRPIGHFTAVDVFAFWKPDENGFWIVAAHHFKYRIYGSAKGRTGRRAIPLKRHDDHWENWQVFGFDLEERNGVVPSRLKK